MVSFSIDDVLKRAWTIRERDIIKGHVIWAENTFSSMLKNLEEHLYTNLYATSTIDTRIIDVMWILRGLVRKYGGEIDPDNSKANILGHNGRQRREMENKIRADESDLGKRLQKYLDSTEYDRVDVKLAQLFDEEHHPYADARKLSPDASRIAAHFKIDYIPGQVYSEAEMYLISKKVADKLLAKLEKVSMDIYADLLSLWDYESTWIRVDGEALNQRILNLGDRTLFNEERSRPIENFAKFFETLKKGAERYQGILSHPANFISPIYKRRDDDAPLFQVVNIFREASTKDVSEDKGWLGSIFMHYHGLMTKTI